MKLPASLNGAALWQLVRFYQAAFVNTLFGLSLYALLIYAGLDRYAAMVVSHLIGMCFNYITYSRHVFRASASKIKFLASYVASGAVNFALLSLVSLAVSSPYMAGIAASLATSVLMFFVLKYGVFTSTPRNA